MKRERKEVWEGPKRLWEAETREGPQKARLKSGDLEQGFPEQEGLASERWW